MAFKAKTKAPVDDVEITVHETDGGEGWETITASFTERGHIFTRKVKAAEGGIGYERRKLVKQMERLQARAAELTDDELNQAVTDGSLDVEVSDADEA